MDIIKGIKLIVFDFDGTLFHLDVDWDRLRSELEVDPRQSLGELLQDLAVKGDRKLDTVTAAELKSVGDHSLDESVTNVLKELIGKGVHVGIFTRNSRKVVERVLFNTDLIEEIDIVGRENTIRQKPDPEGLLALMNMRSADADNAILVGDTYHDIEAARAAGIKVVVVRNDRLAYAPKGADVYIEQLDELV